MLSQAISEYIGHHRRLAEQDDARRKTSLAIGKDSILDAPKKLSTVRKEELILGRWLNHVVGDIQLESVSRT